MLGRKSDGIMIFILLCWAEGAGIKICEVCHAKDVREIFSTHLQWNIMAKTISLSGTLDHFISLAFFFVIFTRRKY
jgi:hypothetical protein